MTSRPSAGAQAVRRAAALLKAFSAARPERRLTDLGHELGLNKSTAHRLLTTLLQEGLLERVPGSEAYRPGEALRALGGLALGRDELREAARDELQRLAGATSETVTLEVRVGREVLIMDEAAGPHVVGAMPSVGERWPLHATSTGKVLLAALPERERSALLPRTLRALTPRTISQPAALRRELARVRERGYATSLEELELGYVAIGAPVRSARGEVVAALSLGGPKSRLTPALLTPLRGLVCQAAARISERMGYAEPQPQPKRITDNGLKENDGASSKHRGLRPRTPVKRQ